MLKDPIELYRYPEEWIREGAYEKVASGLYILTEDGYLRRGITTGTTAAAAVVAAVASLYDDVEEVEVLTPVGISVRVDVEAERGFARARKFAGDHAFDATDGLVFEAEVVDSGVEFGEGIGVKNGRKAVSEAAMRQIMENFEIVKRRYGFEGGVRVSCPEGARIASRTGNERLGISGGISILGTTGFVEPWCEKLVETKLKIAMQYDRIAITTGRRAWLYALRNFPDYQPFVFGVHIDEALRHPGEKIVVGFPGLLAVWAGGRDRIFERAEELGVKVVVIGWDG
ncbi:MAG: cobalt-precorrin-5B (C(1))-methyltransferase [Archaeoglobaceae archaeon]